MTKLTNRVISIFDRKTSMRLATLEWRAVDDICKREHIRRRKLLETIKLNQDPNLGFTESVRLFAMTYMYDLMNGQSQKSAKLPHGEERIFRTLEMMS